MLQRVYGTAFFDKKDLDAYTAQVEEAKKRDHRRLGKELNLFTISPLVGAGLILWLPKGAIVRGILETFIKDELVKRGYQPVYTPHIGKIELYQTSGHYPYYRDAQFPPLRMPADSAAKELLDGLIAGKLDDAAQKILLARAGIPEHLPHATGHTKSYSDMSTSERIAYFEQTCDYEEYLLKPMNCPHHIQIYASQPRSYRELPLRLAEFGTVYRYEQSGELLGLTRVRGFTQDDAHLFCTHEQVRAEFATMEMTQFFLNSCLGLTDYRVRLSRSDPNDPKFQVAAVETWLRAEGDIRSVLDEMGVPYDEAPGEAAFYGPKADFIVRDCIGREWQLGTVQLDYVLPERFALEYTGPDNQPHRPVMIHRAPLGSLERFMGILIEHFAGAFPLWLAPNRSGCCRFRRRSPAMPSAFSSGCAKPACAPAPTCVPRRSEPRSATRSSRRSPPCWWWAPRKPKTRPSHSATGPPATQARCRSKMPWPGSRPKAPAGRPSRPYRRRPG